MIKLKPCPFCGGEAEVERQGTGRQSCIISCTECGCRHEGPDEYELCGYQWNMRTTEQAHAAKTKAEEAELAAAQDLDEIRAERDALAAYVERCRVEFSVLSEYWNGGEGMAAEDAAQNAMDVACDMLEELPETSLARLKAKWQAEAVQATADAIRYEYEGEVHRDRIADYADDMADELRRQAKETNDDRP